MGNPNEIDRELLSAYLDDALDGTERSRAEHLLATSAGAARYFSQLRATRECLKSVPSSTLRSSLSARVLEQARAQALAEGLPNDHHVLRAAGTPTTETMADFSTIDRAVRAALESGTADEHSSAAAGQSSETPAGSVSAGHDHRLAAAKSSSRSRQIMWSTLAAAAAVIGGLAVLTRFSVDRRHDVVAENAQPGPSAVDKLGAEPEASISTQLAGGTDDMRSPFDAVTASGNGIASVAQGAEAGNESQPADRSEAVAHVALDGHKDDIAVQRPDFDYLMIIDAVVSTDAWESGRFEKLLTELGIPIASPIVADTDLFKALEETRVVVGSATEDAAGNQPRAALLFLRADGLTLDRLHQAMHQDHESFPEIVTDVSIDWLNPNSAMLHRLLRSQATGKTTGPSARIVATTSDVGAQEEVVPDFVPAKRTKPVSSERPQLPSVADPQGRKADEQLPMSEVLVILREPSGE